MRSKTPNKTQTKSASKPAKIILHLPPGASLSDLVMDGAQVIQELFISKRTLLNWRSAGRVSYTNELGKIFYFKQEIAQILLKGRQLRKKK